jgi:hypothetical protein
MARLIEFYVPRNFKPAKQRLVASGPTWEDHRVPKCCDQEVCLSGEEVLWKVVGRSLFR